MNRALAVLAVLCMTSCRGVVAPDVPAVGNASDSPHLPVPVPAAADFERQVPLVRRVLAAAGPRGVSIVVHLDPATGDRPTFHDPGTIGGWQFQCFLDVDRDPGTGYGYGWELLTRDSEGDLGLGSLRVRRTEGGGGPGGWGDEVGMVELRTNDRRVSFTIPYEVLGGEPEHVDFWIEMYATVAAEDGGPPTAWYVRGHKGSTDLHGRGRHITASPPGESPHELDAGEGTTVGHFTWDRRVAALSATRSPRAAFLR